MLGSTAVVIVSPCEAELWIDFQGQSSENSCMEIQGTVQNGVVVLDGSATLAEGTVVTVTPRSGLVIHVAKNPRRIEFSLVPSSDPGSISLTNERIGEIFDEEDIESVKRSWNVPS